MVPLCHVVLEQAIPSPKTVEPVNKEKIEDDDRTYCDVCDIKFNKQNVSGYIVYLC